MKNRVSEQRIATRSFFFTYYIFMCSKKKAALDMKNDLNRKKKYIKLNEHKMNRR